MTWVPPRLGVISGAAFPVRQVWCVGRNYAGHAREMGVNPESESPIFFSKPSQCVVKKDNIPYPEETGELHHEVELVVCLRAGGRHIHISKIPELIYGYAVGVDLTRRDVQAAAKQAGHPWEMSKGFDNSAPVGTIVPVDLWKPEPARSIGLSVNDEKRQLAVLGEMIWSIPELLVRLSRKVTLGAGDLVFTGTPAGVGRLCPGDRVIAGIDDLPELDFTIGESESCGSTC